MVEVVETTQQETETTDTIQQVDAAAQAAA